MVGNTQYIENCMAWCWKMVFFFIFHMLIGCVTCIARKHRPITVLICMLFFQILLSCEKHLGRSVASSDLGSLQTMEDLWSLFSKPSQKVNGKEAEEEGLFLSLANRELPTNLSFKNPNKRITQACSQSSRRKRRPFQNYDKPSHSRYHNKQKNSKSRF